MKTLIIGIPDDFHDKWKPIPSHLRPGDVRKWMDKLPDNTTVITMNAVALDHAEMGLRFKSNWVILFQTIKYDEYGQFVLKRPDEIIDLHKFQEPRSLADLYIAGEFDHVL